MLGSFKNMACFYVIIDFTVPLIICMLGLDMSMREQQRSTANLYQTELSVPASPTATC